MKNCGDQIKNTYTYCMNKCKKISSNYPIKMHQYVENETFKMYALLYGKFK